MVMDFKVNKKLKGKLPEERNPDYKKPIKKIVNNIIFNIIMLLILGVTIYVYRYFVQLGYIKGFVVQDSADYVVQTIIMFVQGFAIFGVISVALLLSYIIISLILRILTFPFRRKSGDEQKFDWFNQRNLLSYGIDINMSLMEDKLFAEFKYLDTNSDLYNRYTLEIPLNSIERIIYTPHNETIHIYGRYILTNHYNSNNNYNGSVTDKIDWYSLELFYEDNEKFKSYLSSLSGVPITTKDRDYIPERNQI